MVALDVNELVAIGEKPSARGLQELSDQGFLTIVDFSKNIDAEFQAMVEQKGMHFLASPQTLPPESAEHVTQFRQEFAHLPKPMFACCDHEGQLAGAMILMHLGCERGWSGKQTLSEAHQMGFECSLTDWKQFVIDYVDQHQALHPTVAAPTVKPY